MCTGDIRPEIYLAMLGTYFREAAVCTRERKEYCRALTAMWNVLFCGCMGEL